MSRLIGEHSCARFYRSTLLSSRPVRRNNLLSGQSWQTSPLPDVLVGSASNFLALKAISTNDVWAVGGLASGTINDRRATPMMIMHWDGRRWNATPVGASLQSIAASSSRDVWAVGKTVTNQALVEHWDGQR